MHVGEGKGSAAPADHATASAAGRATSGPQATRAQASTCVSRRTFKSAVARGNSLRSVTWRVQG